MNILLFWCGAAIVCTIAVALCICIISATIIEVRKLFKKQQTFERNTPPLHPNCRHTIQPFNTPKAKDE